MQSQLYELQNGICDTYQHDNITFGPLVCPFLTRSMAPITFFFSGARAGVTRLWIRLLKIQGRHMHNIGKVIQTEGGTHRLFFEGAGWLMTEPGGSRPCGFACGPMGNSPPSWHMDRPCLSSKQGPCELQRAVPSAHGSSGHHMSCLHACHAYGGHPPAGHQPSRARPLSFCPCHPQGLEAVTRSRLLH